MKAIKILMLVLMTIFTVSCKQKKEPTQTTEIKKAETVVNTNKVYFEKLDQILSPFEDMTEFALNKNDDGIDKSLAKVENAQKELTFEKNLGIENLKVLNPKIETLKTLIKEKQYSQIALTATELFEFNITHFVDASKIETQIKIEHLDYMGFKVLALLSEGKTDWNTIKTTITNSKVQWNALSEKVKDNNLKDTFNFLFEGLNESVKNKDQKMTKILAAMDLSLVDVLENSI